MVELIGNTAADPVKGSRSRSADGLFRILVATLFGLFILLAWVGLPFEVPYIGYGLVSAFVFQVAVRPRRWEIVGVVLGGAALALTNWSFTKEVGQISKSAPAWASSDW